MCHLPAATLFSPGFSSLLRMSSRHLNSQVESTQTSGTCNDSVCLHVLEASIEHHNLLRNFAKCPNDRPPATGNLFKNMHIFIYVAVPGLICGTQALRSSLQHAGSSFSLFQFAGSSSLTRDPAWASCFGSAGF